MTDLAVATTPFLDLTFTGLDALPRPGQERFSTDLHRSPGGGAITAVGAARLGLDAVLAGPLGSDAEGALLRESLEREGVRLVAPHGGRTATTVVLPAEGDRAMVTYDPGSCARAEDLEALNPRAIVCGLEEITIVPATAAVFLTLGDEEARSLAGRIPDAFARAHTILVNEAEARLLTGVASAEDAAEALAASGASIVVTRGPHGAVGVVDGERIAAAGVDAGPALDTTGAGDLFTAAFIWAGLHGADPEERLRWAVLYAALSVGVPTATAGAATRERLIEEGTRIGLPALEPAVSGSSSKEGQ
jgi:sugar/nucleoside kinase (ribokinase family)